LTAGFSSQIAWYDCSTIKSNLHFSESPSLGAELFYRAEVSGTVPFGHLSFFIAMAAMEAMDSHGPAGWCSMLFLCQKWW